jgi:Arc/MetJ-type ribon-helix-helix transcriptional regulator
VVITKTSPAGGFVTGTRRIMKKQLVAVRLSEQQAKQLAELETAGFGNQSDIIRTALDRMYQEEKRNMKADQDYRRHLISDFVDMGLGDMEGLDTMPIDKLARMIGELSIAQENGNLNIETDKGIENLKEIVDSYVD